MLTVISGTPKMAACMETCGSYSVKLKELIKRYEKELGLNEKGSDGTKSHAFGSLNFHSEQIKFALLLNSLRTKCVQCQSWSDSRRAVRASLERHQQVENLAPVKNYISECMDKLQHAMRDNSIKGVVQRLEAITKAVGLKVLNMFGSDKIGRDCFIGSDMFYVEVKIDRDGTVSEVTVAHAGEPDQSCPELTRVLREGDYEEFTCHLQGLSDLYKLSGDTFQKSKILMALKAVETDINTLASLFRSAESSTEAILYCPVGFTTARQGGRLMRLTYFASPYDLLAVNNPRENIQFTKESPPPRNFGCQVSVSVEQSQKSVLPTFPLVDGPAMAQSLNQDKSIKYQALNDNNTAELCASFVLMLSKPMAVYADLLQKIHELVNKTGAFVHSSKVPADRLVIREWLKTKKISPEEHDNTYYVSLPQHYHVYHVTETDTSDVELAANSEMGLLVHRIPFTHPSHVPEIIQLLRRQAMYNELLTSALRSHRPLPREKDSKDYVFELTASGLFTITVTFEHPCAPGMASIDLRITEDLFIEANLHTVPGQPLFCPNENIARVTQRCLSIPAAMRSIIRKAESSKPEELPVNPGEGILLTPSSSDPTGPVKLTTLSLPSNTSLFSAMGTPSLPTTPSLFAASPTFANITLDTPSPTISAFPFTSISPTFSSFSFANADMSSGNIETSTKFTDSRKPETPKHPVIPKLTIKRKKADEYVIENFQPPEDLPKAHEKPSASGIGNPDDMGFVGMHSDEGMLSTDFDLPSVSGEPDFSLGTPFPSGTGVAEGTDPDVGVLSSADALAAMGASGVEGLPTGADLFDCPDGGVADLEGILQSLPGASHLPPGIVSSSGALDFGSGISTEMDVDAAFDIDATIDASAGGDPSIAGAAGGAVAFDVDSALFDIDQLTAAGLTNVTSGDGSVTSSGVGDMSFVQGNLLVSGLSGEGSVSMDTTGRP